MLCWPVECIALRSWVLLGVLLLGVAEERRRMTWWILMRLLLWMPAVLRLLHLHAFLLGTAHTNHYHSPQHEQRAPCSTARCSGVRQ